MDGLNAIHNAGYAHRDLKFENVLFGKNFELKIADFGFATFFGEDSEVLNKTRIGTVGYMSPELCSSTTYNAIKADIWAAGICLFILKARNPPWTRAST